MNDASYKKLCIANILNGVTEGLSKYSKPTRVALIFAASSDDSVSILDPKGLLRGHESKLEDIFFTNGDQWRSRIKENILSQPRNLLIPENDLELSGLIAYGGSASDFFYQMWFTEHHPDMCSICPTERWLEQASSLLVHDYNTPNAPINSSDYVLKNYSLQAVADYIVDVWNKFLEVDYIIQIPPILNNILCISKTREEGAWARGVLFFADPRRIEPLSFLTKIQKHERPMVSNVKHIRKLLVAVERSDRKLVSDGRTIIGITDSPVPESAIAAEFKGDYGFLRMGNEKIASFFDGSFHSTTREARLVELEELLLDSDMETQASTSLFRVVSHLVHKAGHARHGCTLVIDLNTTPLGLSGHVLEPPISLLEPQNIDLVCSLLRIDGAIHLASDARIHGFGCLLDGNTVTWENMARGARYNSALRFSAANRRIIVVVVSADRPVSIIYNGIEINAFRQWQPVYPYTPDTPELLSLKQYLNGALL
jgi:hypothetical protein